jgi:hypothetical protein
MQTTSSHAVVVPFLVLLSICGCANGRCQWSTGGHCDPVGASPDSGGSPHDGALVRTVSAQELLTQPRPVPPESQREVVPPIPGDVHGYESLPCPPIPCDKLVAGR